MEIRRIRPEEADAVVELWDASGREPEDGGALTPRGRATIAGWLQAAAGHPLVFCLVAEEAGRIVGFQLARIRLDEVGAGWEGLLEEGHVVAHRRRRGIGRALAQEAVRRLRAGGCRVVTAHAAADDLARARLWQALGLCGDVVRYADHGEPC